MTIGTRQKLIKQGYRIITWQYGLKHDLVKVSDKLNAKWHTLEMHPRGTDLVKRCMELAKDDPFTLTDI